MDLTLGLTHDCNLRCAYCYAGAKSKRRMDWRTAKTSIDFAIEHTLATPPWRSKVREMQLGFFGGEPTLEWELLQKAVEYTEDAASAAGIPLTKTLTTNGVNWLIEQIGGIRLATTQEIVRAQEATTSGDITKWDSYYLAGMKVNEFGIETGQSNAWYFVKE